MKYVEEINNFLDYDHFNELKFWAEKTPWFFQQSQAYKIENESREKQNDIYNSHFALIIFKNFGEESVNIINEFSIFGYLEEKVRNFLKTDKKLYRIISNLFLPHPEHQISSWHIDTNEGITAIFYLNKNDGFTEVTHNGQNYKITSESNKLAAFDSSIQHRVVKQTDTKYRITIVLNYV